MSDRTPLSADAVYAVYDTAVVGGGLAGLSAAILLREAGARVALFEAKTYPHHKVCGEFLSPEGGAVLRRLGVGEAVEHLNAPAITHTRVTATDGTGWQTPMPAGSIGLSRYAMDAMLYERALALGVQVFTGTTVSHLTGDLGEGYTVTARAREGQRIFCARTVLCAHGKRGGLDRALERPFLKQEQAFTGLKAHFTAAPLPNRVDLHTFPGGYCGLSPIEGGKTNLCLLVRSEKFRAASSEGEHPSIEAFVGWMAGQNPHLRRWLAGATQAGEWCSIHQVPFVRKELTLRGMLMLGDAARLIAPLAGDGMGMALQSGELGAAHTLGYLDGKTHADHYAEGYAAAWRRLFGGRLRLAKALQTAIFQPSVLHAGLRLLNTVPPLGRYMVAHTRDPHYA